MIALERAVVVLPRKRLALDPPPTRDEIVTSVAQSVAQSDSEVALTRVLPPTTSRMWRA